VAARSKVYVCGHSLDGIAASNHAGGIYVCLLWLLCVVKQRSLRRADHSSRGVLLSGVRCFVRDREASIMKRLVPTKGCCAVETPVFHWLVLWILKDASFHTDFRWPFTTVTQRKVTMCIKCSQLWMHSPERGMRMPKIFINTKDRFSSFAFFWHKSDNT
jgi:hypothetical protein